jgi:hypothetical protein
MGRPRSTCVIFLFIFIATVASGLPGQAQTPAATPAPIATDRPAVTNSAVGVSPGDLQAENGALDTRSQGQSIADGTETLVRIGVAKGTELRFTLPDYSYNPTASGHASGFGDVAIGVREQLGPTPGGFDVSATVFLSVPTGAVTVSSGGYDPGLQVAWSRGLSPTWTAAGMISLYAPTQGLSRNVTGEFAILVDRQLTGPWDAFVEYAGDFPERGGNRHLLHVGTALKVTARQQVDVHVGAGLSSAAPDYLVGVGYSFRVRVWRP